ncbi:MAG: ATP-binding protein [Anaerolineae bacterium]|nr:ATP-binding protein [Anaerolineae bacterium]
MKHLGKSFRSLCGISELLADGSPKIYHNLPQLDVGRLVGREEELAKIHRHLLSTTSSPVVVIRSIGGIGKTALALEAAHYYLREVDRLPKSERFEAIIWTSAKHEICMANGSRYKRSNYQDTLDRIYSTIAITLERDDILPAGSELRDEMVKKALRQQQTLLIIDNLDTVDAQVFPFLKELPPRTKVILTSRVRVRDWPDDIELGEITQRDVCTFYESWTGIRASWVKKQQISKLHHRIGGIPLALKFCFPFIESKADLDIVLAHLAEGLKGAEMVSFCFDFNWQRLRQESQKACEILKVMTLFDPIRGSSADMIIAVLNDNTTTSDFDAQWYKISEFSLAAGTDEKRYCLLPLVQQYIFQYLTESQVNKWRQKQLCYYLDNLLGSYIVHVDFVCGTRNTYQDFKEVDNLEIIFEWCQTISHPTEEHLQFADGFGTLLYLVGYVERAINVAEWGQKISQKMGNREKEYDFWNKLILYHTWSDELNNAAHALDKAGELSAPIPEYRPDNVLEYRGSYLMRSYLMHKDDEIPLYDAYRWLHESTIIRETYNKPDKDRRVAVLGRFMMGVWHYRMATRPKAKMDLDQGIVSDELDMCKISNIPDEYLGPKGVKILLAKAEECLEGALSLAQEISFERGLTYILNYLGLVYLEQGRYPESEDKLRSSLGIV